MEAQDAKTKADSSLQSQRRTKIANDARLESRKSFLQLKRTRKSIK